MAQEGPVKVRHTPFIHVLSMWSLFPAFLVSPQNLLHTKDVRNRRELAALSSDLNMCMRSVRAQEITIAQARGELFSLRQKVPFALCVCVCIVCVLCVCVMCLYCVCILCVRG